MVVLAKRPKVAAARPVMWSEQLPFSRIALRFDFDPVDAILVGKIPSKYSKHPDSGTCHWPIFFPVDSLMNTAYPFKPQSRAKFWT